MSGYLDYIPEVLKRAVEDAQSIDVKGKVIQVVGTIVKASVPGVKIGDNCVIGAGSVVTHEIPASTFAAGVPARVIRSIGKEDSIFELFDSLR